MQYIFLSLISIPFFYFNYKIIISDIKEKIIPNKYLIYLLEIIPFFYIYTFSYFDINYLFFFFQIFITIIIGFILYYFGIWGAGDAKYLAILGLYMPQIGIITFILNISILTILYLFFFFIYFYFGRCLFNWGYSKSLYKQIYIDLKDKYNIFLNKSEGKHIYKIIKWLILFLIIFVSIRLARTSIISYISKEYSSGENNLGLWGYIIKLAITYNSYFVVIVILTFFLFIYLLNKYINIIKIKILKYFKTKGNKNINKNILDIIFILILGIILVTYIIIEYIKYPIEISESLKRIFTFYIFLYIVFKILRYSYHITFQLGEYDYIDVNDLKSGVIIDKKYLINLFGTQKVLSDNLINDKGIGENFLQELENPINDNDTKKIKSIFEIVNNYHKNNNTEKFQEIKSVRIIKTFSFGLYIFLGFIISFIYSSMIFEIIIKVLFKYLHINI